MAMEEGWETFVIPPDVGGRFSVLTPVGLLPMAVAGINICDVMLGAAKAKKDYDLRSFENPVWLYAAIRNLLYRKGKAIELLTSFEPAFKMMGGWWQQLFGESEGKDGKGLFPVTAEFTADLHSLGQMIQQGQRNLFETMVRFAPPAKTVTVGSDWKNLDGLNYLEGRTFGLCGRAGFPGYRGRPCGRRRAGHHHGYGRAGRYEAGRAVLLLRTVLRHLRVYAGG